MVELGGEQFTLQQQLDIQPVTAQLILKATMKK